MKSNNQYLEKINESVGGQVVDERKPNNWYLRSIAKNTGSQEIHGHRTDNYYLKRIALNMEDLDVKELLETIAELRGEVEDLEELLANDIHLFSCCKDIVQTGESLGLFAYCKHDGELEGNTVYFYALEDDITDIVVKFTGKTIERGNYSNAFVGENVVIKWGDGTTTNYTSGGYSHTYDVDGEYTITISNVTAIGNSAFVNTDITEVFIPSHIVSLGSASFAECDLLEEVTLSEGLTSIGDGCFSMNPKLTEITIPSTVTDISYGCFSYDPIQNINLLWKSSEDIIQYVSNIWGDISTNYKFTIPRGTTALYEAKGYPSSRLQER